jgi:hypothetical protein
MINRIDTKIFITLGMLACFFIPLHSQAAIVGKLGTSTSALVGWWKFDEGTSTTAADFSGNGNTGTLVNAPTWGVGKRGKAMVYDGTNKYVEINQGSAAPLNLSSYSAFSISAWVNIADTSVAHAFVGTGNPYNIGGTGTIISYGYPTLNQFCVHVRDGGTEPVPCFSTAQLTVNKWAHVVFVYTSTAVTLYVNGVFIGNGDISAAGIATLGSNPLRIGAYGSSPSSQNWQGGIDDFRVYNKALTATDVFNLYRSGEVTVKKVTNSGLRGWWTFDEGTSTTIGDASGNGNGGSMVNPPATWITGKRGGALQLNGTTYINVPTFANFDPGAADFSMSIWIKGSGIGDLIQTSNSNAGAFTAGFGLLVPGFACGNNKIYFNFAAGGVRDTSLCSNKIVTDSVWHNVAVVVNRTTLVKTIYIDGVADNSNAISVSGSVGAARYAIGQAIWQSNYGGALDDMRFYNRALSADEVLTMYRANQTKINSKQDNRYTNGLVGYWTFNGPDVNTVVADITGNGNNGYWIGSATTTALIPGKVGQTFKFNGDNNIVQLGTGDMGISSAFTVSSWIKTSSATAFMGIMSKDDATNRSWKIGFSNNFGVIRFDVFNAGSTATAVGATIVNDGEWHLITGTYDGTNIQVYVDGNVDGSPSILAGPVRSSTAIVKIGTDGCCAGRFFNGPLDEARLYNRALSAAEVKQLYRLGK